MQSYAIKLSCNQNILLVGGTIMTVNKTVYVSSYGDDQGNQRGIVKLDFREDCVETTLYPINGKVNCCIDHGDYVYVPVKEANASYLYVYKKLAKTLHLQRKSETSYFYSYGFTNDDHYLYLASYEQGVDARFDLLTNTEIIHVLEAGDKHGKSHYIGYTPDKAAIFAIDNGLQNINFYDAQLNIKSSMAFDNENIRLMSYSSYSNRFYMNTEKSNVVYVLAYSNGTFQIEHRVQLLDKEERCFSGGNAISVDGKYLCISIRGSNELQCYAIAQDGAITLFDKVACGDMPRDVAFVNNILCVSCTLSNIVELYRIDEKLIKFHEIPVLSPITFSLSS